jgi:dTDP-4-amino-4,6-dideoxygalactose transaminase
MINSNPAYLSQNAKAEFAFSRGSVALFALLRSAGIGSGDEVILTGFTCVVVAEAVRQLGARPVYVDIDASNYGTSPASLYALPDTSRMKALVVQHSFGIPADMGPIMDWAGERRLIVIEDCALSLGSSYKGTSVGSFGDATFWSGQWSKPIPVGKLGVLQVNDPALVQPIRESWQQAPGLPIGAQARMAVQTPIRRSLMTSRMKARLQRLHRTRRRAKGLPAAPDALAPYTVSRGGGLQHLLWRRALASWDSEATHRRRIVEIYEDRLPRIGYEPVGSMPDAEIVYCRYPVRVSNKTEVLEAAEAADIEIGDWMDSPLHQATIDLTQWDYRSGMAPEGERAAAETINLPVHRRVSPDEADRIMCFLRQTGRPA